MDEVRPKDLKTQPRSEHGQNTANGDGLEGGYTYNGKFCRSRWQPNESVKETKNNGIAIKSIFSPILQQPPTEDESRTHEIPTPRPSVSASEEVVANTLFGAIKPTGTEQNVSEICHNNHEANREVTEKTVATPLSCIEPEPKEIVAKETNGATSSDDDNTKGEHDDTTTSNSACLNSSSQTSAAGESGHQLNEKISIRTLDHQQECTYSTAYPDKIVLVADDMQEYPVIVPTAELFDGMKVLLDFYRRSYTAIYNHEEHTRMCVRWRESVQLQQDNIEHVMDCIGDVGIERPNDGVCNMTATLKLKNALASLEPAIDKAEVDYRNNLNVLKEDHKNAANHMCRMLDSLFSDAALVKPLEDPGTNSEHPVPFDETILDQALKLRSDLETGELEVKSCDGEQRIKDVQSVDKLLCYTAPEREWSYLLGPRHLNHQDASFYARHVSLLQVKLEYVKLLRKKQHITERTHDDGLALSEDFEDIEVKLTDNLTLMEGALVIARKRAEYIPEMRPDDIDNLNPEDEEEEVPVEVEDFEKMIDNVKDWLETLEVGDDAHHKIEVNDAWEAEGPALEMWDSYSSRSETKYYEVCNLIKDGIEQGYLETISGGTKFRKTTTCPPLARAGPLVEYPYLDFEVEALTDRPVTATSSAAQDEDEEQAQKLANGYLTSSNTALIARSFANYTAEASADYRNGGAGLSAIEIEKANVDARK